MEQKLVMIEISNYLSIDLVKKLALAEYGSDAPQWQNRIIGYIRTNKRNSDCFYVIASNQNGDVVGGLYCIRNTYDATLWYYGNLFVVTAYRRNKIAERMVQTAIRHLTELGASALRAYVDPDNQASLALQRKLGFMEKETEPFNDILVDGDLMFEKDISQTYELIQVNESAIDSVQSLYQIHRWDFCGNSLPRAEFGRILSSPDKRNDLICLGCMPVGWLSARMCEDCFVIDYFIISDQYRRRGIGDRLLAHAIRLAKEAGAKEICTFVTQRNLAANKMAQKHKFVKSNTEMLETGDEEPYVRYTYRKKIE